MFLSQGPRFTWTNNRDNDELIMERLDSAYASPAWLEEFPNSTVYNFPITSSDHAPIMLKTSAPAVSSFRPYQVETWCLSFPDVRNIVQSGLNLHIVGSPMYSLSRKLSIIRKRLQTWCLDHKLFWGVNWNSITSSLASRISHIETLSQGISAMGFRKDIMSEASLAYAYWQLGV